MMKPLIVIAGPTASGKTNFSIEIAKRINGEIISADSMQIYKYMNIGTAKPSVDEMQGIKHYLIDEIYPDVQFSVAQYKKLADKYINKVIKKGKIPILVGGTGLYINSVIDNIKFSKTIKDDQFRKRMKRLAEEKGNEYVHNILKKIDPASAKNLHVNNLRRIIRALEVYKYTKVPMSKHQEESKREPSPYNLVYFALYMDREKLYSKINKRVDIMIKNGLVDEVKDLLSKGYDKSLTSMKGIGYKEIIDYIEGKITFDEAVEIIKRDTRRYAKRQLTWFRRDDRIIWIDVTEEGDLKKRRDLCINIIEKNGMVYYNK